MEIKAKARLIRMAPRKVRLVADLIKGKNVLEAQSELEFVTKVAKGPVIKVLKSAIANAENNYKLKRENLYVKSIIVDAGPTIKRWKPRAYGRAAMIRKRTSHITIVLDEIKK